MLRARASTRHAVRRAAQTLQAMSRVVSARTPSSSALAVFASSSAMRQNLQAMSAPNSRSLATGPASSAHLSVTSFLLCSERYLLKSFEVFDTILQVKEKIWLEDWIYQSGWNQNG